MTDEAPPRGWKANELGVCPGLAKGKRVIVKLRNGTEHGREPVSKESKAGWPADESAGRGPVDWRLTGSPFDVVAWDFLGKN